MQAPDRVTVTGATPVRRYAQSGPQAVDLLWIHHNDLGRKSVAGRETQFSLTDLSIDRERHPAQTSIGTKWGGRRPRALYGYRRSGRRLMRTARLKRLRQRECDRARNHEHADPTGTGTSGIAPLFQLTIAAPCRSTPLLAELRSVSAGSASWASGEHPVRRPIFSRAQASSAEWRPALRLRPRCPAQWCRRWRLCRQPPGR
jgi:hypothetical protein